MRLLKAPVEPDAADVGLNVDVAGRERSEVDRRADLDRVAGQDPPALLETGVDVLAVSAVEGEERPAEGEAG